MILWRRRLSRLASLWLVCQLGTLVAAPIASALTPVAPDTQTAGDDEECCPGVGPGQFCPMHHAREGARTCRMANVCANASFALIALVGGLGVLPSASTPVSYAAPAQAVEAASTCALDRPAVPDSPPPRA
jgi:hypothetical protein